MNPNRIWPSFMLPQEPVIVKEALGKTVHLAEEGIFRLPIMVDMNLHIGNTCADQLRQAIEQITAVLFPADRRSSSGEDAPLRTEERARQSAARPFSNALRVEGLSCGPALLPARIVVSEGNANPLRPDQNSGAARILNVRQHRSSVTPQFHPSSSPSPDCLSPERDSQPGPRSSNSPKRRR